MRALSFIKGLLLVVCVLPVLCFGQSVKLSTLEEKRVDEFSHDTIVKTYWHTLSRGVVKDPLNISFRICRVNSECTLEIKMMDAGSDIVIPKNAPFELSLENGELVTVYNADYRTMCRGCGAISYNGSDAPGIMLSYPLNKAALVSLRRSYLSKIRLYSSDGYWYKKINEQNSELFMTYLELLLDAHFTNIVAH